MFEFPQAGHIFAPAMCKFLRREGSKSPYRCGVCKILRSGWEPERK